MFRFGDILSLCLVFAAFTNGSKFPSDIPRCKYSDTECLRTVATRVLRTNGVSGHRGLNLVPYEPLYTGKMLFEGIPHGPVSVQLKVTDAEFTGSKDATVLRFSGFTKKASDLMFEMHIHYTSLNLTGQYRLDGYAFEQPINGQGHGRMTFEDVIFINRVNCSTRVKHRSTYLNLDRIEVDMWPKRITFAMENLFHGNKPLGNYVNRVMNERWTDLFKQLRTSIEKNAARIALKIISGPFSAIPYDKLFL